MSILAATTYDPSSSASFATTSLAAMAAVDTSNLRVTFTVPANGIVLVRIRGTMHGATSSAQVLFGILAAGSVVKRQAPMGARVQLGGAANTTPLEALFLVTGLSPGASLTWDAAIGVEFAVASSGVKYGGPNNGTANDAWGGFSFEVWETQNLLAGVCYDPAIAVTKTMASAAVIAAADTTNLRLVFTVPQSGRVLVRQRFMASGGTGAPTILGAILEGSTVRARAICTPGPAENASSIAATSHVVYDHEAVVTGLTPAANLTWDAAWGPDSSSASVLAKWGGPDNATQDDAYGGYSYEVWAA